MATNQDTIWENFLAPFFRTFLIDEVQLNKLRDSIDWEKETGAFQRPNLVYPDYYSSGNFHGIEGGYLTSSAAVTYDPITQYVLPPSETWVRQMAIKSIEVQPSRIVDLGCGTGSTTVLLKSTFPQAEVTGLDLSPYMLVMATRKGQQAEKHINWIQADAQDTGLPEASYDLVTASLLFHETPPTVSQQIFLEASRLLKPGGQMIVLDGNQRILRQTQWL
ncbi:MAG: class I SAM-dependent methyltransferase, partial [Crocosphaera sp.]